MSVPGFQRDWPYISFMVKEINLWRSDGSHLTALTLTRARARTHAPSLKKLIRPPPSHPFHLHPPNPIRYSRPGGFMCALLSFLLLFTGKKLRREDIRWEASDKGGGGGGAEREDRKRAEATGATQNIFKREMGQNNVQKQRRPDWKTETRSSGLNCSLETAWNVFVSCLNLFGRVTFM